MPRPNSGLAPNLPQTGARPNRIRSPPARGLEWARIRQKIGWPPSPAAPAPSAGTRSRNRRFGRVHQDNPPFGQRRDEFDDAVVSPIGTTVQSVSTQKALAGSASLSYDGKAVEYDHPFAATAAGSRESSAMRRRAAAERSRHQPSGRDPITLLPSTNTCVLAIRVMGPPVLVTPSGRITNVLTF